ncbi:hypothetical protein A3759_00825 [Thalassolituus sp. HI0120]|nr:hypothetical protein A3759_00825 [Thalassolituus sp. HI0120]
MRLLVALKKSVPVMMATLLLLSGNITSAETIKEKPSAGAMIIDAVLARPLYFVLSQGGALVYGATLPFTLLGGNADEAAEALVVTPLQAAFVRCLGCGKIDSAVGNLDEGNGKIIEHFVNASVGYSNVDIDVENNSDSIASPNLGLHLGTHFRLSDRSRFDVALGVKQLMLVDTKSKITGDSKAKHSVTSYQLYSRFGKEVAPKTSLLFKLGFHSWNYDVEGVSDSGFGLLWGIGADYRLNKRTSLGLDFTRYSMSGTLTEAGNSDDFDLGLNAVDLSARFFW